MLNSESQKYTGQTSLDSIRDIRVFQKRQGYRFSIDSLLVADFVVAKYPKRIADLGSGCGIIGILLAKRFERAEVVLVELLEDPYALCLKNIVLNALTGRVNAINADIRDISQGGILRPNAYDLVVSNPPFRTTKCGKISPYDEKAIARHEVRLTLSELVHCAFYLLRGRGRFCFIYHPCRFIEVIQTLKAHRLEPRRVRFIHSVPNSEASMFIVEAVKEGRPNFHLDCPFFIYESPGVYSKEALSILQAKC